MSCPGADLARLVIDEGSLRGLVYTVIPFYCFTKVPSWTPKKFGIPTSVNMPKADGGVAQTADWAVA